ncbi:MAG: hypothetical protein FWC71_05820 [Defluviitaleaceae bacterium]|nr:hypothetical protein [Defluviitaleaceae bacterium]
MPINKVTDWVAAMNKHLSDAACKATHVKNIHTGDGIEYYHGKTKIKVCKLVTKGGGGANEYSIVMHGNHLTTPYSIVDELPANMLHVLKNQRGCRPCANPRTCTMAGNGDRYYEFAHSGKTHYCCGSGFRFGIGADTTDAELALLEKWLIKELRWHANDTAQFPERKIILDEIPSSYAKRWAKNRIKSPANGAALSVFDLPNKEQSQIKPPIDEACDHFLKDTESYLIATDLINHLRKQGATLHWKARNKYVFRYKKMELAYIRFENQNDYNIEICAFGWREQNDVMQGFIESFPADKRALFIQQLTFHCHECNAVCHRRIAFISESGDSRVLCSGKTLVSENPSPTDVDHVKWGMDMGKNYIDYKVNP